MEHLLYMEAMSCQRAQMLYMDGTVIRSSVVNLFAGEPCLYSF